jgi:hypothetical protein
VRRLTARWIKVPIAACRFLKVKQEHAQSARGNVFGGTERHARLDRITRCACQIFPRGRTLIGEKDISDIHRRVARSQEGIRKAQYRDTDVWLLSPDRRLEDRRRLGPDRQRINVRKSDVGWLVVFFRPSVTLVIVSKVTASWPLATSRAVPKCPRTHCGLVAIYLSMNSQPYF